MMALQPVLLFLLFCSANIGNRSNTELFHPLFRIVLFVFPSGEVPFHPFSLSKDILSGSSNMTKCAKTLQALINIIQGSGKNRAI